MHQKKILSLGFVLSIFSAIFLVVGVYAPAIDFSSFNPAVDLQYSLIKICQNIGLISSMWRAIPIGFLIAAVMMLVLAFVEVPIFRIIPCMLALAMILLMALDIGNVINWIKDILQRYFDVKSTSTVNIKQIFESMMYGIYFLIAGIVSGVASIFVR
jgi:hypothetical protein